jgi:RimJ/RimL family protein N-acetyltransferase
LHVGKHIARTGVQATAVRFHVFEPTSVRTFANMRVPPQASTLKSATRPEINPSPNAVVFLDALRRRQEFHLSPTVSDLRAADRLLEEKSHKAGEPERAKVVIKLRAALAALERIPASEQKREMEIQKLFERYAAVLEEWEPDLQQQAPVEWKPVSGADETAADAREPADELARFPLKSGKTVSLQAIGPGDMPALAAFISGLSEVSTESRFSDRESQGPADVAAYFVSQSQSVNPSQPRVSLVLRDDQQRIVGLMDYAPYPEREMQQVFQFAEAKGLASPRRGLKTCGLNMVIADALQGQGIGQRLLDLGVKHARQAGYQQLVALVSEKNTAAARMLERMGWSADLPAVGGNKMYVLRALSPPR